MNIPLHQKDDHASQGFTLQSHTMLKCMNCDKPLVELIAVKDDVPFLVEKTNAGEKYSDNMTFQCNCPFCNSQSFKKKFFRQKVYMQAVAGVTIDDTIINNEKTDIKCNTKLQ